MKLERALTVVSFGVMMIVTAGCGGATEEEQACLDTAEATARAAQRCGQDYQQNLDTFVSLVAGGDCGNITRIRDRGALYDQCLPALAAASCMDLMAGRIAPSCRNQLGR